MEQRIHEAMVVDPDSESRLRLKQAAVSVPLFGDVQLCGELSVALRRLDMGKSFDVVFIAEKYHKAMITEFIKQAKQAPGGRESAYVLVLGASYDDEIATVARGIICGADGVLMEPYSVDSLVEMTELAARVRQELAGARERALLSFLVKDIIKQIDLAACLKACDYDIGRVMHQLREMCGVLPTLDEEAREKYYEIMLELFESAAVPSVLVLQEYHGASVRVKKMLEKKLQEHLASVAQDGLPDKK